MFPELTRFLKRPVGWEKLGRIDPDFDDNGEVYNAHDLCRTIVHIGRENKTLFRYCPRCLVKIKES